MRCGTPGASGHVTAKPSIRKGACFINPASTRGTFCVLPREVSSVPWEVASDRNWLSVEGSALIAGEKSAEGIVVPQMWDEGPNGSPKGDEKRGRAST
jgi:hypothetical protein